MRSLPSGPTFHLFSPLMAGKQSLTTGVGWAGLRDRRKEMPHPILLVACLTEEVRHCPVRLHPKPGCFCPKPHPGCVEERAARGHTPAPETAPHGCPGPLRKGACRTQEAWDLPFGILNPRSPSVQELEISGSKRLSISACGLSSLERGDPAGAQVSPQIAAQV